MGGRRIGRDCGIIRIPKRDVSEIFNGKNEVMEEEEVLKRG